MAEIDRHQVKSLRVQVTKIDRTGPQKLQLIAKQIEQQQQKLVTIHLEGVWTHGHIIENTILHLVNPICEKTKDVYTVNNSHGLLVIEPDDLLTCTLVASTLFCERKTWLNNVFLGQVGTNRAMLVGTLVHEVFQYGVKNKIVDMDKLIKHLDDLLDDATTMLEIYSVELHIKDVRDEAISYFGSVKEWIEKFMLAGPRHPLSNDSELEVKIIGIHDIEENVWSPKYGLKGKIDVTGSVRVYDRRTKTLSDKTLPLELKTGNPNLSSSHAAQVSLYSMMIEDRYKETNQGLVIYLKDKAAMHNVTLTHNIKRDLVQRRNQINYHMKSYFFGPDMIDQPRLCKGCDRLTECLLMSNLYTPHDLENCSSMKAIEPDATGHLDDKFRTFFKNQHEKLARLMVQGDALNGGGDKGSKSSGSFWNYSSKEAEARGSGFGKLEAVSKAQAGVVTFRRHPKHPGNLINSDNDKSPKPVVKKMKIEDYFKPKQTVDLPKTKPFDTELNFSRCRIAISLDDDETNMDSQNSSTAIAIGFMQELKEDHFKLKIYEGGADIIKPNQMYRVDKIEKRTNLDIERLVLVRLLTREDWRCDRIRQLLLDPQYVPIENLDMNLFVLSANFEDIAELDGEHQKFVVDAVSTDNYSILDEKIVTSKSKIDRIISILIRVICNLDRTVLVVGQNIDQFMDLMRLLSKKVKFILIDDGKSTKARYQYASNLVKVPQDQNMELTKKYDSYIRQHEIAPIVITTYAMSVGGLLFTRRTFDYCIAYDCDNTELLVGLSPMFCSDRHIMIDVREASNGIQKKDNNEQGSLGDHLRSLRAPTQP